ncbi:hypothetical protein ABMY20_12760 [Tenacibaculum sp. SSH1-16]|uniref:hypothetical protein n=1 Tax=Tenacibaculum sp. SSH1-16 TaxID=3136667 RepID=UPI0032C49A81
MQKLENQIIKSHNQTIVVENLLQNIDVSVDLHKYAPSWAVISIQGEKSDYIKFVDLGRSDIQEIQRFLRYFDRKRVKVDAPFPEARFLKINQY